LHAVHNETVEQISKLCRGKTIEIDLPQDFKDDWTNTSRGYSWLGNYTYVKENRPLLKILMEDPDLHLASVDRSGRLQYNTGAMLDVMQEAAAINRHLGFLAFTTPGQPSRMSEFADHKIRNSVRPRTILATGMDVWQVTRRVKYESLIHHEVFVPVKLHPELAKLLVFYLLVIRPLEIELAWILWGEANSVLYEEYLWVQMGHRVMEHHLGNALETLTQKHCSVGLSPRPYRQLVVAIARVYLGSEYEINEDEDDVLARQACHGPKMRIRTYAPEEGRLPCMSSDLLLRYGHVSEAWWKLTQFYPGALPLLPLMERRLIQQDCRSLRVDDTIESMTVAQQSAPVIDTAKIIENLTASMTSAINTMRTEMVAQIQEGIAKGLAEVLRRQPQQLAAAVRGKPYYMRD
jgi:hypothetical protein